MANRIYLAITVNPADAAYDNSAGLASIWINHGQAFLPSQM
jgi:hypothetical protein